jgi:hypothetical protein
VQWAALFAWLATATGGSVLMLQWFRHGGAAQDAGIRTGRLLSHAALAVIGLALWLIHIVTKSETLGWIAVATVALVGVIGLSMLALWLRGRSGSTATSMPAESSFPFPIVVVHGLLGAVTITLSVLALV